MRFLEQIIFVLIVVKCLILSLLVINDLYAKWNALKYEQLIKCFHHARFTDHQKMQHARGNYDNIMPEFSTLKVGGGGGEKKEFNSKNVTFSECLATNNFKICG